MRLLDRPATLRVERGGWPVRSASLTNRRCVYPNASTKRRLRPASATLLGAARTVLAPACLNQTILHRMKIVPPCEGGEHEDRALGDVTCISRAEAGWHWLAASMSRMESPTAAPPRPRAAWIHSYPPLTYLSPPDLLTSPDPRSPIFCGFATYRRVYIRIAHSLGSWLAVVTRAVHDQYFLPLAPRIIRLGSFIIASLRISIESPPVVGSAVLFFVPSNSNHWRPLCCLVLRSVHHQGPLLVVLSSRLIPELGLPCDILLRWPLLRP